MHASYARARVSEPVTSATKPGNPIAATKPISSAPQREASRKQRVRWEDVRFCPSRRATLLAEQFLGCGRGRDRRERPLEGLSLGAASLRQEGLQTRLGSPCELPADSYERRVGPVLAGCGLVEPDRHLEPRAHGPLDLCDALLQIARQRRRRGTRGCGGACFAADRAARGLSSRASGHTGFRARLRRRRRGLRSRGRRVRARLGPRARRVRSAFLLISLARARARFDLRCGLLLGCAIRGGPLSIRRDRRRQSARIAVLILAVVSARVGSRARRAALRRAAVRARRRRIGRLELRHRQPGGEWRRQVRTGSGLHRRRYRRWLGRCWTRRRRTRAQREDTDEHREASDRTKPERSTTPETRS